MGGGTWAVGGDGPAGSMALLRGCAFDGLGGDDNAVGRLDLVLIRGEGVPRAALMTSMRLVFVLGFPNATKAVGGRLITNLLFVAKTLYVIATMRTIKHRKTKFIVAITGAHFTNRRSVPGLLLELKRGRRVDAAGPRDRRRSTHDERDERRAQNRLAGETAALRRDERPLPACFFFKSVVRVATASKVFSCGDEFHHR